MLLLAMTLLAGAQDTGWVESAMSSYRARTRAEVPCAAPGEDAEIVVCARREADEYRVPLVTARSPRNSAPAAHREIARGRQHPALRPGSDPHRLRLRGGDHDDRRLWPRPLCRARAGALITPRICIHIGSPARLGEPRSRSSAWATLRSGPSWVTIATSTLPSGLAPRCIRLSIETPASRIAAAISASTPTLSRTVKRT